METALPPAILFPVLITRCCDWDIRRKREAGGMRRKIGRREKENEIKRAFIDVGDPAKLVVLLVSGHKMDNRLSAVSIHCVFTIGHHN